MTPRFCVCSKGSRLRAAFLLIAVVGPGFGLAGCHLSYKNPLVNTISALLPGHKSVSKQAAKVPYASIDITVNGRGGLFVLAQKASQLTFFQAGSQQNVMLRDGYLAYTSGLDENLQMTSVESDEVRGESLPWRATAKTSVNYVILRRWQEADGSVRTGRARGRLSCKNGTRRVKLPLATLALQHCRETLDWDSGKTTSSVYWRDPDNHRIWVGDTVPWPGAPHFHWQVARPWW